MDLILVDLDGPVFNSESRADASNAFVEEALYRAQPYLSPKTYETAVKEIFYHKDVFYHQERMRADQPVSEAHKMLLCLEARGLLAFLTSRPEYTREVTTATLSIYGLLTPNRELYMKPDEWQYLQTLKFKVGMVRFLRQTVKPSPSRIILIDDEKAIREEVAKLSNPSCTVQVFSDLNSASATV